MTGSTRIGTSSRRHPALPGAVLGSLALLVTVLAAPLGGLLTASMATRPAHALTAAGGARTTTAAAVRPPAAPSAGAERLGSAWASTRATGGRDISPGPGVAAALLVVAALVALAVVRRCRRDDACGPDRHALHGRAPPFAVPA